MNERKRERARERDSGTCLPVDMFYSRGFLLLRAQSPSKIDHLRAPFQTVRRLTMYNFTVYLPRKRATLTLIEPVELPPLFKLLPFAFYAQ